MIGVAATFGPGAVARTVGLRALSAAAAAWWELEKLELTNPHATAKEKLLTAAMAALGGLAAPVMSLAAAGMGMAAMVSAVDRGLSQQGVMREVSRAEVVGAIAGGALEAGLMGAMSANRSNLQVIRGMVRATGMTGADLGVGAWAAVGEVLMDVAGAYVGYQLGEAMGIDPWEGAKIGLMLGGGLRVAAHAAHSLSASRTENSPLRQLKRQMEWKETQTRFVSERRTGVTTDWDAVVGGARDPYALAKGVTPKECETQYYQHDPHSGVSRLRNACFAAGTMLLAKGPWGQGWRAVERITADDLVASRDEYNPAAPVGWKAVEELFTRAGPV